MIESEIHWGDSFENVLSFAHPQLLDDRRTWRRPVPGSARTRNSAGTTDSWAAARDFLMAVRARHFSASEWPRLQAFLDYAGPGAPFRFVPDNRYRAFYVDNCILEEPFDNPEPSWEQSDAAQSVDLVLRQQAFDFNLALRGLMFEYVPGESSLTDPAVATFSRSGAANRRSMAGILTSHATDSLRAPHFVLNPASGLYEPSALLELAFTQLVANAQTPAAWTDFGTPIITTGQPDPWGTNVAILVEDNDAANREGKLQAVTFTADGSKVAIFAVRAGSADRITVILRDFTAGSVDRHAVTVSWQGGTTPPTVATQVGNGTIFTPIPYYDPAGNLWWLIPFSATGVVAANVNQLIAVADPTSGGVGTFYFAGANAWNATIPFSWHTGARNADVFSWPTQAGLNVPQELTAYVRFIEQGTASVTNARIFQIGGANDSGPRLLIYRPSQFTAYHQNANGGSSVTSAAGTLPSYGAQVELRLTFSADGRVQIGQSINGAAETVGAQSAALAPAALWGSAGTSRIYLNSDGAGLSNGATALLHMKIAAGVKTMAEMRAA